MNHRLRCLVVEDSDAMRQLLVLTLARIPSLQLVEAPDGLEALRLLAAERFDLIVTDLNMPVIDGLKFLSRIRSEGPHQGTPVVIVTTVESSPEHERALSLGVSAYLTKPLRASRVLDVVRQLVSEIRSSAPPPS